MAFGQSSFRRILLSRLLLLSVPVLLMGVYVTYRKARSAFLETARKNLTESAILKGESISQSIEALKTNLANASDAEALQSDSLEERLTFVAQLKEVLPTNILCTQLTDLVTNNIVINTCGETADLTDSSWHSQRQDLIRNLQQIDIDFILPSQNVSAQGRSNQRRLSKNQLVLWLSAPVYDHQGNLRYALSVKSSILSQERVKPGSFEGYSVVIDQEGVILAHPSLQRVGLNIRQMPDAQRLSSLLRNAIAGESDFLHLFYLEKDGVELVAGYSSIDSPIGNNEAEKWVILAVAPLDTALFPLKDIRQVLVVMTVGLIVASSCANLYISRELARPLELIRDYALKEEHLQSSDRLPDNFQIREFNQLAVAINEMVARLRSWGDEILTAWKEAKNANQLKSEFLATTSHELRTPLNGIINCIRVVKDGYCDDREEELDFLNQADEAAIHLLGIINDVLDISKIEAGRLSVVLEKVELGKLISEVVDLQIVPIQHKGLSCKTPNLSNKIYVQADRAKLKQVLINVIGNAVKFTESGYIEIKVAIDSGYKQAKAPVDILSNYENYSVSYNENNYNNSHQNITGEYIYTEDNRKVFLKKDNFSKNGYSLKKFETAPKKMGAKKVIITIQDTGIGIEPSQQDKLFRPFVMVDGSKTRKFGGTGLGLAISRNLIELMNGEISLNSKGLGKGTTITIVIPVAENI
ncbi:MAG: ATP-binding protein [Xenococcaceae cyanobacterium MO_167.B27]|nr:ATP-binding protein [Xenococcaceae cyanobacterium MO_167.B27]